MRFSHRVQPFNRLSAFARGAGTPLKYDFARSRSGIISRRRCSGVRPQRRRAGINNKLPARHTLIRVPGSLDICKREGTKKKKGQTQNGYIFYVRILYSTRKPFFFFEVNSKRVEIVPGRLVYFKNYL